MQTENESVLVIILAETRAHEHTFALFKKNLLDRMGADLCLCVAKNQREDTANPFYQHASYIFTYDEPEDWGDAFDAMQAKRGLHTNWRQLLAIRDQWLGGVKGDGEHPGSAAILLFFRMFLKEVLCSSQILDRYDRFVITRSDFVHRVPHVPLHFLAQRFIWIPDGEDYGGYTDRHIVAHRDDLLAVLSIGDRILAEPEKLYGEMCSYSAWNLERYIKFAFGRLGLVPRIRRFPYSMYSVRPVGGHTRWSSGSFDENLGYYIKYRSEYAGYKLATTLIQGDAEWTKTKIFLFNVGHFFQKLFSR